jgi:hypothetical protein
MKTTYLRGNTYEHRDDIRRIPSARWDRDRKAWVITPGTMRERAIQSEAIYRLRSKGVTAEWS